MSNTAQKIDVSEKKIIFILGTPITTDNVQKLHTATCDCGNRMWVSAKKESLNHYIEKMKGTCCRTNPKYTGEKFFKGKELVDIALTEIKSEPIPVEPEVLSTVEEPEMVIENKQSLKEVKIDAFIQRGRKGITNKQMIGAIIKCYVSAENLTILFDAYPDIFKSSAKYVPDYMKVELEKMIRTKDPTFNLPIGKKTRARLNGTF